MKAHEILLLAKPMIDILLSAGISPKDVQYISLYNEYIRLKAEGHKVTYIEAYLCDEFNIRKTKFYELIKQFDSEV